MSKGSELLTNLIQELFPRDRIDNEHHIGERLMLDIYVPRLNVAAEYHGKQHFEFNLHFHKDLRAFRDSQMRDARKEQLCDENGIALAIFTYEDDLIADLVYNRIMDALEEIDSMGTVLEEHKTYKDRQKEYRQEQYRRRKRIWDQSKSQRRKKPNPRSSP